MSSRENAEELIHIIKDMSKNKAVNIMNSYSRGEMPVLGYLMHHLEEGVVPSEIGHVCQISTARVANILNALEEKNLVTREIDKNDRRKILVRITETGKAKAMIAKDEIITNLEKVLEEIGENDSRELLRLLRSFIEIAYRINFMKDVKSKLMNEEGLKGENNA
ncbi:MarR family winged helix-turn-helix transcriptional regulator [Lactovum miscens]|uniref:DNA-binding MarR family transcriptional regulator n=1 Tax=Lactovum miscens TaxID=190387 RepID=A0A841C1S8_9LACT|nr:MarR family transcriptional regulator [Lactovum miscens]MBB5887866.1 DNA-binding MarR family transcriptional regulator [Lactovum miscens]